MYSPQTAAELNSLTRKLRSMIERMEGLLNQREEGKLAVTMRQQIRQRKIIVETVSKKIGVPPRLIYLRDRHERVARARQVCMAIACSDLNLFREQTGRLFKRCPNAVSKAQIAVQNLADADAHFASAFAAVRAEIKARLATLKNPRPQPPAPKIFCGGLSPRRPYKQNLIEAIGASSV
jgi:chromosomal replication initiation ATPase DnaA